MWHAVFYNIDWKRVDMWEDHLRSEASVKNMLGLEQKPEFGGKHKMEFGTN